MKIQPYEDNTNPRSKVGELITTPRSIVLQLLLACGVVGPVLFNLTYLIEGATRPGYNSLKLTVSALESGPLGWIQIANFIVFGVLIGCFAVGLRKALVRGFGAILLPILEGCAMLGLIGDGIFTQDPLHLFCDILALSPGVVASFVFARRFAGDPRWRGWATYSIATARIAVVLLIAFGVALTHNGPAGLFEKLATLVRSIFSVLLAARLVANPGRLSPQEGRLGPQRMFRTRFIDHN